MKQEIMRNKEALLKIVANADAYLASVSEVLAEGDVNGDEFKDACDGAARVVIIKAAINSLGVMQ